MRSVTTGSILLLILSSPLIVYAYVVDSSIVVPGTVIDKRESITMPLEDTWRRSLVVIYQYQPRGSNRSETAAHPVDAALYDRLTIGSPVQVRYSPVPLFRHIEGLGSALTESSWLSRLPAASEDRRELVEAGAFCAIALAGFLAYRIRSWTLGLLAATAGGVFATAVFLIGFLVFPGFFVAWRANRGRGVGVAFLATVVLGLAALYYRVPRPASLPDGSLAKATATVRTVRKVDQIWASASESADGSGGQRVRQPFQMVDLEFTPPGADRPVHVLDRVDLGSVPGLEAGRLVAILYSPTDPRSGRLSAGTRHYGDRAFVDIVKWTVGLGTGVLVVLLALVWIEARIGRAPLFSVLASAQARAKLMARSRGSHRPAPQASAPTGRRCTRNSD